MSEWELALLYGRGGVLQRGRDVVSLQVGEIGQDLFGRTSRRELTEHGRDGDPQPTNAWNAAHLGRVDRDPFEVHHARIRETVGAKSGSSPAHRAGSARLANRSSPRRRRILR
jgi:hypothetical protein